MKNSTKGVIGVVVIVLVIAGALVFSDANLFKGSMRGVTNKFAVKFKPILNVNTTTTVSSEFKTKCQSVIGENACWQESPMTCWMHGGGCGSGASYTTLAALNAEIARMEAVRAEFKTKCRSVVGENACWQESPMTCWMHGGGCGSGASYTTLAALNAEITRLTDKLSKPTARLIYQLSTPTGADAAGMTNVTVFANDNIGVIKVEFTVDGQIVNTWNMPSADKKYNYLWDTLKFSNGEHLLGAIAYDAAGNKSETYSITTYIRNPDISEIELFSHAVSPERVRVGEPFDLTLNFKNMGEGPSRAGVSSNVFGRDSDGKNYQQFISALPKIEKGEMYTLTKRFNGVPKFFQITACIEYFGQPERKSCSNIGVQIYR